MGISIPDIKTDHPGVHHQIQLGAPAGQSGTRQALEALHPSTWSSSSKKVTSDGILLENILPQPLDSRSWDREPTTPSPPCWVTHLCQPLAPGWTVIRLQDVR